MHKTSERIIQKQCRLFKRTGRWEHTKNRINNIIYAYYAIKTRIKGSVLFQHMWDTVAGN
jgi:hypothetical protein